MRKTIKLIIIWILLYIPVMLIGMGIIFHIVENHRKEKYRDNLKHIGEKIEINNLVDLDNNRVKLQYKPNITIIDFWFKGCKPCIEHMEQFIPLISGMDNKISVISISVDDRNIWEPLFKEDSPLPFLTKKISNWKHYSVADTTFKESEYRTVTRNASDFLLDRFGVKSFPFYMVLDRNGNLIDVPASGLEYIEQVVYNQSAFRVYWTKMLTGMMSSKKIQTIFMVVFVGYSLFYWLIIFIFLLIRYIRIRITVANRVDCPAR